MRKPISLIIFDLGGVVLNIYRDWEELCFDITGKKIKISNALIKQIKLLNYEYHAGKYNKESFCKSLSLILNQQLTLDELIECHDKIIKGPYPGILLTLNKLNELGKQIAILSNTCPEHWEQIKNLPEIRSFDKKLSFLSYELELSKPNPEIFKEVEKRTGKKESEILFFDDSRENIKAAEKLGWKSILVPYGLNDSKTIEDSLKRYSQLI